MINSTATDLWTSYTDKLQAEGSPVPDSYEAWYFCNNEQSANKLARLVYNGTKQATASLVWSYEAEGETIPRTGDHSVITLWDGTPVCIIQASNITVHPFDQVPESFAFEEGEGDRSLDYWRKVHWHFFSEECAAIGRQPSQQMPVVCESFRVVFKVAQFPIE